MFEFFRKGKKPVRQDWKPHWVLGLLQKLWMILFSAFKIVAGAAATVLLIVVVCGFVFVGVLADYLQEDIMPSASNVDLGGEDLDLSSFIYYIKADGQIEELQQIYAATSRQLAALEEIPKDLIHAAVAIEDKRFYEHQGVDWFTTIKAFANMFFGEDTVGGSSITQQLIKNQTGEDSVTVQRKVLEFFRATNIEKRYDKDIIITEYLNSIYLGQGCRGVKSAAEAYFGKELRLLTTAECASLIAITNNPSLYDPYMPAFEEGGRTGWDRNTSRKEIILDEMLAQGWISEEEHTEAINQQIVLKSGIADEDRWAACTNEDCDYEATVSTYQKDGETYTCPQCGKTTDIAQDASQEVYSWFVDTLLEDVAKAMAERDGMEWNDSTAEHYKILIGKGGYHIYSTLDMEAQNAVDKIYQDLKQIPDTWSAQQLESGIVVVDNRTGDIVAMAGGVGEKTVFDAHSIATDAKLQSGSSIKPLSVYAPAFEMGSYTPATVITDLPLWYEDDDSPFPRNDNRKYSYSRSLYSAIKDSVNAVAANTLSQIGTSYGFKYAKEIFGLSTLVERYQNSDGTYSSDIDYSPLAMGAQTVGVSLRDMTNAFATFANDGMYRGGRTFTKVYDNEGNLVLDNTQESEQIISKKTVDYINYCLTNAVDAGTGRDAKISGTVVAGKTGSTSSFRDRWFCGYTEYYTAAVWCGYRDPEVINLKNASFTNPAAHLWMKVMTPLHMNKEAVQLYDESKMTTVEICLDSGKLATDACKSDVRTVSRVDKVMVYKEDRPTEVCDKHVTVDYCVTGNGVANEYCKHLYEAGASITMGSQILVKLTQSQLSEILRAEDFGLDSQFLRDDYVYLVDAAGNDASFKGFHNNINGGVTAPYKACTVHTKSAWDAYQAAHPTAPPETTEPSMPNETTGSGDAGKTGETASGQRSFLDGILDWIIP